MKTRGFYTFLILWGMQTVSILGSSLTTFAINLWLVQRLYPLPEQKQQLALALTALGAVEALCIVATSPLAGWWVDRHDRKRTMLLADFASCCSTLALAFLLFSGRLTLWSLLPVAALGFAMRSFHTLAFRSSYVMLVPEEQLPRANGMMESSYWLSGILAPSLAVAVIALPSLARGGWLATLDDGMPLELLLDGATFLLAAFTLPFLRIPSPAPPPQPVQRGHPALEGLRLLRRYPSLL